MRRPPAPIYVRSRTLATASAEERWRSRVPERSLSPSYAARISIIAAAALIGSGLKVPAHAAASPWTGDAHAAARLITATAATGSARRLEAGIEIRLAPGWHTYWRSPGDAGIAPRVDWRGSQNLARIVVAWPAPRRFSLQGVDTIGYAGDVVLPVAATLMRQGQPAVLHAVLDYAACSAICVPYHAALALAVPAGPARPAPEAALIARFAARVPKSLAAAGLVLKQAMVEGNHDRLSLRIRLVSTGMPFAAPDLFVEGRKEAFFGRPAVALSDRGHDAELTVPVSGTSRAELLGNPLTLTLVDGARAAEFSVTPVTGTAAE